MFMYLCGNRYYEAETSMFSNIAPARRVGSVAVSWRGWWRHTPLGAWLWLRLRCQRFFRLFRTFSNIYGHIYESYLVICMYVYIFMWKYVFWRRNTDHLKRVVRPASEHGFVTVDWWIKKVFLRRSNPIVGFDHRIRRWRKCIPNPSNN